jgi:hypothetical protein
MWPTPNVAFIHLGVWTTSSIVQNQEFYPDPAEALCCYLSQYWFRYLSHNRHAIISFWINLRPVILVVCRRADAHLAKSSHRMEWYLEASPISARILRSVHQMPSLFVLRSSQIKFYEYMLWEETAIQGEPHSCLVQFDVSMPFEGDLSCYIMQYCNHMRHVRLYDYLLLLGHIIIHSPVPESKELRNAYQTL